VWLTSLAKEHPHPVGRWYHLALVYKNGVATHYVNGSKEMSGNINYLPLDSAYVSLGMRMNQRSFFRGAIRTVRMTNCALRPSEFKPFIPESMNIDEHSAKKLLFSENFEANNNNWISELEHPSTSSVAINNGKLDISTSAGATVWFREKLSGNIMITYDAFVKNDGGVYDRVSDLNAFWMATDPKNDNLFTRNGKFSAYDDLNLYYSGIGGHDNTTTRFRKYQSLGEKPVLREYLDQDHLLNGNTLYKIKILVNKGRTQFYVNDELYFDFTDSRPYREGYFAFRTTKSHQLMDNFSVYRLSEKQGLK
jgi:rhamnogalacturonan endolyase